MIIEKGESSRPDKYLRIKADGLIEWSWNKALDYKLLRSRISHHETIILWFEK